MRRRFLLIGFVSLLSLTGTAALPLPATAHSCGGVAPDVLECGTGEHVYLLPDLSFEVGNDYSGRLLNLLTGNGNERFLLCEFEQGVTFGCIEGGGGSMPVPAGEHICQTFDRQTSAPGGVGRWACIMRDLA